MNYRWRRTKRRNRIKIRRHSLLRPAQPSFSLSLSLSLSALVLRFNSVLYSISQLPSSVCLYLCRCVCVVCVCVCYSDVLSKCFSSICSCQFYFCFPIFSTLCLTLSLFLSPTFSVRVCVCVFGMEIN